jgi:hypothetical protein
MVTISKVLLRVVMVPSSLVESTDTAYSIFRVEELIYQRGFCRIPETQWASQSL